MSEALAAILQLTAKGSRITATGTYTATKTGWHKVRAQGAGGGSGGVRASGGTPTLRSGGGGAGEFSEYMHFLTAGTAYTVTIGAAGTAGAATPTSGGNGGSASFAGPVFTQSALGGQGTPSIFSAGAIDDPGATGGRRDGVTTPGANAVMQGPNCWGGANGGTANGVAGGSAGAFSSPTSSSRAGSGASSLYASGGGGASSANTAGSAGSLGSGGGGSWTATTTGIPGAAGGAAFVEVEFIGT